MKNKGGRRRCGSPRLPQSNGGEEAPVRGQGEMAAPARRARFAAVIEMLRRFWARLRGIQMPGSFLIRRRSVSGEAAELPPAVKKVPGGRRRRRRYRRPRRRQNQAEEPSREPEKKPPPPLLVWFFFSFFPSSSCPRMIAICLLQSSNEHCNLDAVPLWYIDLEPYDCSDDVFFSLCFLLSDAVDMIFLEFPPSSFLSHDDCNLLIAN